MTERDMYSIRVGDVIQFGSGDYRVARAVHHYTHPHRRYPNRIYVYFAIRHGSWTRRAWTVLDRNDLRQRRYRLTGVRVKLNKKIDRLLKQDIETHTYNLSPKDVRGLP